MSAAAAAARRDAPTGGLPFTKMQGVGNDFVLLDEVAWAEHDDWPSLARALCDRRLGVGGDGLLVVGPSMVADLRMRMFNPDGTEDMCGNGLRCAVRFAWEQGRLGGGEGLAEALSGVLSVSVQVDDQGGFVNATTSLGVPHFAPADLPMVAVPDGDRVLDVPLDVDGEIVRVSVVSTGTTHTVIFVPNLPGDDRFLRLSPRIESHSWFPERTSVLWAVVDGPDRLRLRIWERGAGETLGCGTGAAAAAVLARVHDYVREGETAVQSKGGTLHVRWPGSSPDDAVTLTGPAETVFQGRWPESL